MPLVIKDTGIGTLIEIAPDVIENSACQITVNGSNNRLVIGAGTRLPGGLIEIRNNNSAVEIGERCMLNGRFCLRANHTRLVIGDETTMMGGLISLHETGTIRLGRDCMLSGNVQMDVSDMHSILDAETGKRINPPEDIEIGDHVWIAQSALLLKGSRIGAHSMIGAHAVVNSDIPDGSLAVGSPARVIRTGITWDRRRLPW